MAKRAIFNDVRLEPQQLLEQHALLDRRVRELDRRVGLTPAEQIELSELKKRKLAVKDRLQNPRTQHA